MVICVTACNATDTGPSSSAQHQPLPVPVTTPRIWSMDERTGYVARTDVVLFLEMDVTERQRSSLLEQLRKDPRLVGVFHETPEVALMGFRTLLAQRPDLTYGVDETAMPESFRLDVREATDVPSVISSYQNAPGVDLAKRPPTPAEVHRFARGFAPGPYAVIQLSDDITDAQLTALRRALNSDPSVVRFRHRSKAEAWRSIAGVAAEDPALAGKGPADTLAHIVLELDSPSSLGALVSRFRPMAGVVGLGARPASAGQPDL